MHKFRSLMLLALVTLLIVASVPAGAADPIEFPAVLSLTGGAAFLGRAEQNALNAAAATVNKAGGIHGRQVVISVYDDQTNPQVAVQLMTAALQKKPLIVFDGGPAATCRATAALVPSGPVLYCFTPAIEPTPGGFVFSSDSSSNAALAASVRYLRERGFKRIAILNGTDASGQEGDRILADVIKDPDNVKAGVTYVDIEHYGLTDLSVIAQLTNIRASGAQAVINFTTGTAIATVLHGMQDLGLDIPLVTSPGNMSYPQLESYKSFLPKELLFAGSPLFVPDQLTDQGVKKAVVTLGDALKAAGQTTRPDLLNAVAWDPMMLVAGVLNRLGPDVTPDQLRTALANTRDAPGVLGRYDYRATPQRGLSLDWIIMERWDGDKDAFVAVSKPGGTL